MHNTYTSGAARRNEMDAHRAAHPGEIDFVNKPFHAIRVKHREAGRINPILDYFRDDTYNGDPDLNYVTSEWLFQLGRHWALWQSPRIGTFPHDYRDPFGPVTRDESAESGEDSAYWAIEDALASKVNARNGDGAQDYIVHATAVIGRLYSMSGGYEL